MYNEPIRRLGIKDRGAAKELYQLLEQAAPALLAAGEPALVAAAPNKFNDADQDDLWYAVQARDSFWEQAHYFWNYSQRDWGLVNGQQFDSHLTKEWASPPGRELEGLRRTLDQLETGGWRALAAQALEGKLDTIQCLAVQQRQLWFCRTSPVEDDGDAWLCLPDGRFRHFGGCSRIDDTVGTTFPPISFWGIDPTAVASMAPEARAHFEPTIRSRAAHGELSRLLTRVAKRVAERTDRPCRLDSRAKASGESVNRKLAYAARVIWDVVYAIDLEPPQESVRHSGYPDEVRLLQLLVGELEQAEWRDLFGLAYGTPLLFHEMLSLFVHGRAAVLLRGNTLFAIQDDTLHLLALRDMLDPSLVEAL